ncbi:hypothetical protein Ahy_B01g054051 isoform A [Arachis hypogaea]|uniref:Uncharacterized protein n=1 Tax=Arachis hypogaea TaxID=3818 RepID=A0A445AT73_ARAHY|nr:hypothetical protein Ahy_B01g054051 isoform A [Arachis hypogaea]
MLEDYVRGMATSLFGSTRTSRRHCMSIERLMRGSRITISQTELTGPLFCPVLIITCVTQEFYTQRLEAATQQSQHIRDENNNSVASEVDPNIVWHETTSDPYKNRIYELGSFFADNLRTSTLRPSFASATNSPMEQQMPVYQDQMRASGSDAADGSGTSGGASAPPPSLSPQHD